MTGFMVVNVGVLRLSILETRKKFQNIYLHISHDIKCKLKR